MCMLLRVVTSSSTSTTNSSTGESSIGVALESQQRLGATGSGLGMSADHGPALYGSSKFWVLLKSLKFSEGRMKPNFDPNGDELEVVVDNPQTRSITMFLDVEVTKYDNLHQPEIVVNGKVLKYRITDTVAVPIQLDESIGAFDKTFEIILRDPHPSSDWFASPATHTYHVRVKQAPEIQKVIAARSIKVLSEDGTVIEGTPAFDADSLRSQYQYSLKPGQAEIDVQVDCHPEATGQAFDGSRVQSPTKNIKINGAVSTVLAECLYRNEEWTHGQDFQRTYVLSFVINSALAHTAVSMHVVPGQGFCSQPDPTNTSKGITCRAFDSKLAILAECSEPHVEMTFVNSKTRIETRMINGLPISLTVPDTGAQEYMLMLQAGDQKRGYPVQVLRPASCTSYACPVGLVTKKSFETSSADGFCYWEQCTDRDTVNCCEQGPTTTSTTSAAPNNVPLEESSSIVFLSRPSAAREQTEGTEAADTSPVSSEYAMTWWAVMLILLPLAAIIGAVTFFMMQKQDKPKKKKKRALVPPNKEEPSPPAPVGTLVATYISHPIRVQPMYHSQQITYAALGSPIFHDAPVHQGSFVLAPAQYQAHPVATSSVAAPVATYVSSP